MRFNFSSVLDNNFLTSSYFDKSFVLASNKLNWVPKEVSMPARVFKNQARVIFPSAYHTLSNDEFSGYLSSFSKRIVYLFSYKDRIRTIRPSLMDLSMGEQARSRFFSNFFFRYFVDIPNNKIIFFRSNGYSKGSILFSQLNLTRLVHFSCFRYQMFFGLFSAALRPIFTSFVNNCRFKFVFFKSMVAKYRVFSKNFIFFWRNAFRQKKLSRNRSKFFAFKLAKIIFRRPIKYLINFFVVHTLLTMSTKFYHFNISSFYGSAGSFQFNNFRFGAFNPRQTRVIISKLTFKNNATA